MKVAFVVKDQELRRNRHRAILRALRDSLVSPDGALVATMLPHLTGLQGVITVRTDVGRSPLYSALESDFVTRLSSMVDETCKAYQFTGHMHECHTYLASSWGVCDYTLPAQRGGSATSLLLVLGDGVPFGPAFVV
jgi:hypothetical protein